MHTTPPPCYQTNNAVYIPICTSSNPHNPVWGFFFTPTLNLEQFALKKESMKISLSGNSGSGDFQQEFWLAREDLQNVGSEPKDCLASTTGNFLQKPIFTLIYIYTQLISIARGSGEE